MTDFINLHCQWIEYFLCKMYLLCHDHFLFLFLAIIITHHGFFTWPFSTKKQSLYHTWELLQRQRKINHTIQKWHCWAQLPVKQISHWVSKSRLDDPVQRNYKVPQIYDHPAHRPVQIRCEHQRPLICSICVWVFHLPPCKSKFLKQET